MEAYVGYKLHAMVTEKSGKQGAETTPASGTTPAVAASPAAKQITATSVILFVIMLVLGGWAVYLSFTSNKVIDLNLENVTKGSGAGTFVNVLKAMHAGSNSTWYLLYYFIFKKHRINTLMMANPLAWINPIN